MSVFWLIGLIVVALLLLGALTYWQLVIAEGAHLGQRVVTALYDLTARQYDTIKQFDPLMEARYLGRPFVAALNSNPAPLVLDIATGTARLPIALFDQPGFQGKIIGVDDSLRMLGEAASKTQGYRGRLRLIWVDAARLPFPDETFDATTCLEMLEFTPHPARQLAEVCRVLKPGGLLVTTRRRGFDAMLMPGKTHRRDEFHSLLLALGMSDVQIEVWQMDYDLVWARKPGSAPAGVRQLTEILQCPTCGEAAFSELPDTLRCDRCGETVPVTEEIVQFNGKGS